MNPPRLLPAVLAAAILLGTSLSSGCSRSQRASRLQERIDRYLAAGDLAAAEIECRNLLQLDATHSGALRRLGIIYWDQGRELRAVPLLRSARDLDPADTGARVRLARFFLSCGDHRAAAEESATVLRLDPADPDAPIILATATAPDADSQRRTRDTLHALPNTASAPVLVGLGIVDLRAGRTAAAEAAFHHALRADAGFTAAHHALGMLRWGRGDLTGAADAFRSAAEAAPRHSPHPLTYARFLARTGHADQAGRLLEEVASRAPDHLPTWIARAELAATTRDYSSAEAHLKEALRRDPGHATALAASARLSLSRGDPAGAVATLERLRALHPALPQAGYELALACLAAGDVARALALLDEVVKSAPALREAVLARAELGLRRGNPTGAAALLEPLVREHPDLPAARVLLAAARWGEGRSEEAIRLCLEIEQTLPADPQAPYWRGLILAGEGRGEEARAALKRALELAPGNFSILERLVEVEMAGGHAAEARNRLASEISRPPPRLEPALLLARVLSLSGDVAGAEEVLVAATARHADAPVAHYALALLRHTNGRNEAALPSARRALELQPRSAAAALLIATLQERRGDLTAARAAYERVVALKPDQPAPIAALARLLLRPPADKERALSLAQRARQLRPDDASAAAALGSVLQATGDPARALPFLRSAERALPEDARISFDLGQALLAVGEDEAARAALQRALAAAPQGEGATEARDALAMLGLPVDPPPIEAAVILGRRLAEGHDDPATRVRLASILERGGKPDEALRNLEAALTVAPAHAPAALLAARIHGAQGRPARAIELLKVARTGAATDARLTQALGRLVLDTTYEHPWALSLLQEAARISPGDPEGEFDLARALYANGQVNEAVRQLAALRAAGVPSSRAGEFRAFSEAADASLDPAGVDQAPETPGTSVAELWRSLRRALQRAEPREALRVSEQLIRRWPHFTPGVKEALALHAGAAAPPEFLREPVSRLAADPATASATRRAAGLILCRLGEQSRGAAALESSLPENPIDAEALLELGRACLALGRAEDGREFLRRALAADPPASLAAAVRAALGSAN